MSEKASMEIIKNGGEYLSCFWLQHGIRFDTDFMWHCCITVLHPIDNVVMTPPFITFVGKDTQIESLIDIIGQSKLDYIYKLANCDTENDVEFTCANCHFKEYKYWKGISINNFQLKNMVMVPHNTCNANCSYCRQEHSDSESVYDFRKLIYSLIDNGNIKIGDIDQINWEGGEPALMPNFDELFELLEHDVKFTYIPTSAIKYSDVIAKRLNMANWGQIVVSLDSGTRATYQKVKRVDQFERVVDNLKKYYEQTVDKSRIKIKYIVLPENCSFKEIDSFFDVIINNMPRVDVVVSRDMFVAPTLEISLAVLYFHSQSLIRLKKPVEAFAVNDELSGINAHIKNITLKMKELIDSNNIEQQSYKDLMLSSDKTLSMLCETLQQLEVSISQLNDAKKTQVDYKIVKVLNIIDKLLPKGSIQREIAKSGYYFAKASYKIAKKIYKKINNTK